MHKAVPQRGSCGHVPKRLLDKSIQNKRKSYSLDHQHQEQTDISHYPVTTFPLHPRPVVCACAQHTETHTHTPGMSNCTAQRGHGIPSWLNSAAPEVSVLTAPRLLDHGSALGTIRNLGSAGFKFRGSCLYLQPMPLASTSHPRKGNPAQGLLQQQGTLPLPLVPSSDVPNSFSSRHLQ